MGTTDALRATFHEQGLLHLPAAIATIDADRMAARIWDLLDARDGIRREDPATWAVRQPTGFQSLTRAGVFAPMASTAVRAALDDLLGRGSWQSPDAWGAPLVTFPEGARAWDVPSGQWHLDFVARESAEHLPGVRILGLLVDVQPRGGATLIIGGSHRLVERLIADGRAAEGHSAHIRDELAAAYPWLGALWSRDAVRADRVQRFMTEGATIDGVQLRVIELTGAAGDVFLMHPWTLHAPAPNCGSTPRLMVSQSVFRSPPSRG